MEKLLYRKQNKLWSYCLLMLLLFFSSIGNSIALNLKSLDDAEPVAQIGSTTYSTLADAVNAATTGQTVQIIAAGNYTLPALPNITIEGTVDGVVFNHTSAGNIAAVSNGATFKNVTFNFGTANYHGFQHAGTINMEGCTLNGKLFSYGNMVFTNCNFIQSNSDYNMWCYSGDVTYNNCTFTNQVTGKFLNVYNEDGTTKYTVICNGCSFVNQGSSNKSALNIKSTSGTNPLSYDVTITDCTTSGSFPASSGDETSELIVFDPLVQVDDRKTNVTDALKVTFDGTLKYENSVPYFAPLEYVAQIGETKYVTLQAAVTAAQTSGGAQTIQIIDDISGETVTIQEVANFKLTIDGRKDADSNYTVDAQIIVDGLRGNGGSTTNGASVTLQNMAFVNSHNGDAIQATHYPHNLTIQDCTYTGTTASLEKYFFNASVDGPLYGVTIKDVTVENARLIYANLADDALFENIVATTGATVGFNVKTSGTALIKNCRVTTAKYAFRDYKDGYEGTFTLEGNTFISTSEESDEGVIVNRGGAVGTAHINVLSGTYTGHLKVLNNKEGVLAISGGYFSEEFPQAYIAEDLVAQGKVCVPATDKEGYFTIGDPHYVAQIGETKYVTIAAAVAAVPADGSETTIVMIDDYTINSNAGVEIPANKNVVLDLNGKTIKGVVQNPASAHTILNKGTLVITDSCDEKNGTITNEVSDENAGSPGNGKNWFSDAITNNGTLTVNAGNIVNTGTGGACYAIDNITNGTLCSPVLNIAGGNISAKKVAVRMFCNSTTNDNTVNITGGVVSSENAYAIQAQQANDSANKAKLNISGGTLSGQYAFVDNGNKNVATQFDNASYSITGGFFSGYMWSYATYYCGMEGFVSGGYFDNVVGGDLVVPGSACIDNTDEETKDAYPYTIGLADVHYYWLDNNGQIDGGGYYTIYAPFAGPDPVLMDGEFIELQKDVTLTKDIEYLEECSFGDPIFKGGTFTLTFGDYTIDLNGFKFPLPIGVTVNTDKQTDIFSSLTEGYKVYEFKTATGYKYVCDHFEAECAGTYYKTFAEAAGVANGRVITLLDNISDTYAMSAGETLRVSKGGYSFNTPSAPESYSVKYAYEGATTVYTLTVAENFATINGYFRIKNNGNDKYVNVIGRRTATVNTEESEAESLAGTVIKVESNALGQVEVLRSQAVDIPHYAERAMSYVPDFVKLVVDKLHVDGSGEILGSTGVDAIMQKFNDNFDYHLYVENVEGGYRIFGRTPSMKPVVEFYYENKAKVDAKLPGLEAAVNAAIDKVVDRIGRGESLRGSFDLHKIWVAMGGTLTEPTDQASKVAFLQEVLTSETNVWNFGYQTVMQYVNKVENSSYFDKMPAELKKYWNLAKQAHPDFKYYIVQKDGGMDFISEGNIDIKENNARTIWTLEPVEDKFEVTIPENTVNKDGEYFTTLYTDFGYQLPSGVTALKVTGIDSEGVAQTEKIGSQVAAQTPVLLKTDASGTINITVGDFGSSVSGNLLHGADYVINEYDINNSEIEGLFNIFRESISYSIADDYEYLLRMNSGTVNNKYFFPIEVDGTLSDAYKAKTGNEMEETPIHYLGVTEDGKLAFIKSWEAIPSNGVYMFDEAIDPIYLDKPEHPADIAEGYYRIKNVGNDKYVNVIGRKTATVSTSAEDAKTLAGTVLKVKATEGVVEILRSQAIDLPYYAQRAMSYVPDVVELVVSRLGVDGSGEILGSTGVQAILDKFNANFDYHLHVEYADEGEQNIRIYGKTPSMRPVVEFYKENKDKVDAKLPNLESEINEAIRKIVEKAGTGSVLLNSFNLETIWQNMGGTLTRPVDAATKLAFLQEVLKNEKNVWNFAYQTAIYYMGIVEGKPEYFDKLPAEIKKYWNLAKQVRPNFKYYIVQKDGAMDFISEGNADILEKNPRTMWNLEPAIEFTVNIPEDNSRLAGKDKHEYYTTIYTDFGYQLPEGVTALKVTEIKDVQGLGLAVTEEIGRDVAAQTPVLVKASEAGEIILTVGDYGTPVTGNLLHGADWLINEYEINNPTLEGLYDIFKQKMSASIAEEYEYLLRRNSGTVNNKYFFPLEVDGELSDAYKKKTGNEMENSPVRVLGKNNNGKFLAFYESWDNLDPNAVYIFSEDYNPVFLYLIGDVDRDGDFDLDDVNATIDIVLNRDTPEDDYDYEAADADVEYEKINLNDVNTLIDLVLHRISLSDIINKMLGE